MRRMGRGTVGRHADGGGVNSRLLDHRPRPQAALGIGDQLALQLLPPGPRLAIGRHHHVDEAHRQVDIVLGPPAGHRRPRVGLDPRQQRQRPRRRRHQRPRPGPGAQPQLQIVPRRLGLPPFRQFVAPGEAMLRPAQSVGIVARIELRHRSARPAQPLQARLPLDRDAPLARHRQYAARPLDHHRARLVDAGRDQRDPLPADPGQLMHPFRPGPGLAEAAPGHHQPHPPALRLGRKLVVMRAQLEARVQRQQLGRAHVGDHLAQLRRRQRPQPPRLLPRQHPYRSSPAVAGEGDHPRT